MSLIHQRNSSLLRLREMRSRVQQLEAMAKSRISPEQRGTIYSTVQGWGEARAARTPNLATGAAMARWSSEIMRMDGLLQQLGPRLRDARQTANLTVREVGKRLGVDHSMIVRYENSESLPPLDRLIALAALYGLTPAALLARQPAAVPIIAAIDQAEAGAIARLASLLDRPDSAL